MDIFKLEELKDNLHDYYQTGGGETFYFGFNCLSNHYSIKEGGCTDWTGYPGSGKTELLLEGLKNSSVWYKHKHLINMPDAGTPAEVIAKLIHKFTGKQFEEFYYDKKGAKVKIKNRITEVEMFRALTDVLQYFLIFNPNKGSGSKLVTPKQFWDFAAENKRELGIFSAVIDSWNYMLHDIGSQREDKWLEQTLSYRNDLAERSGIHCHTIIHPRSAKKDKSGKLIMPDMHHLKGGSEWGNNGKTIIIVHRDFGSKTTDIRIDKAKPKVVGVQGNTSALKLDLSYGGYYEMINGKREYAHKEPIIVEDKPKSKPKVENVEPDSRIESGNNNDDDDDLPF